jgi:hypothetical protein
LAVFLIASLIVSLFPQSVHAAAIDVGSGAADLDSAQAATNTWIDFANPADGTGEITSVQLWFNTDATGVKVGTFSGSGTDYDDRDYEVIPGTVTAGAVRTYAVNIDVVVGDFIGVYFATGTIEYATAAGTGIGIYGGDAFGGGVQTYTLYSPRALALYGTGSTLILPTVTTSPTADITISTATGHGNITAIGSDAPTVKGICYSSVNNPPTTADSEVEEIGVFGVEAITEPLVGLIPGTTYYVRAFAINLAGTAYGVVDTFATLAWVVPTVATGVCSGFTANAAVLNGMVTTNGDAVPTQYGFEYGLTTSYGTQSLVTAIPTLNVNYWANLTGLTPATVYHWRAISYNGAWGYGVDKTFSTKGSPVLYEHLNTSDNASSDAIYGNIWGYQQFTISDNISHTLTSINLYLKRVLLPGTVTVSIKHAAGGLPTGNDLVSATFNGSAISTSYVMVPLVNDAAGVPININLEGAGQYAVVIAAKTGDASNYILWGTVGGGALAGARYGISSNGGLSYVADAGNDDALFEIWGNPCIEVLSTKVFTSYKEPDDWLILADVNNTYVPYYPNNDPQLYFQLQLISGATIKASTSFRAWGRQPLAIYLNQATAAGLTWGGANYKIRIQSLVDATVYSEYTIVTGDWSAGSLLYLDSYVRTLASTYETYNSTTYLASIAGQSNQVLNEAGSIMFIRGVPGLEIVRPDLFYTSFGIAKPGDTSHTLLAPNPTVALGADAYGRVAEVAALLDAGANDVLGWILLGLALVIGMACTGLGEGIAGIIIGLFFAGAAGFVFGGIPIAVIGVIGFVFLMLIVLWIAKIVLS